MDGGGLIDQPSAVTIAPLVHGLPRATVNGHRSRCGAGPRSEPRYTQRLGVRSRAEVGRIQRAEGLECRGINAIAPPGPWKIELHEPGFERARSKEPAVLVIQRDPAGVANPELAGYGLRTPP